MNKNKVLRKVTKAQRKGIIGFCFLTGIKLPDFNKLTHKDAEEMIKIFNGPVKKELINE